MNTTHGGHTLLHGGHTLLRSNSGHQPPCRAVLGSLIICRKIEGEGENAASSIRTYTGIIQMYVHRQLSEHKTHMPVRALTPTRAHTHISPSNFIKQKSERIRFAPCIMHLVSLLGIMHRLAFG